jgi:hypothetical protein
METMTPCKLWICLAAIAGAFGTVSTLSIQAAPSASSAIVAIRVSHQEVFWAKVVFRDSAVDEAEFYLNEAWSTLDDRRYKQSVLSAYAALQKVRDIKGGVPSLYSRRGERKGGEPEKRAGVLNRIG